MGEGVSLPLVVTWVDDHGDDKVGEAFHREVVAGESCRCREVVAGENRRCSWWAGSGGDHAVVGESLEEDDGAYSNPVELDPLLQPP